MIRRRGLLKVFGMAAVTLGRKSEAIELPDRSHLVTGIAVHNGMGADQWKPILVLIDVVNRYLPAICVVAQLAFGAVLAPMQISVAVLALVGRIGKFEISVTVAASHFGVAPAKRKAGPSMIKFDLVGDDLPICRGVACGARQIELAVRTLRGREGARRLRLRCARTQGKREG